MTAWIKENILLYTLIVLVLGALFIAAPLAFVIAKARDWYRERNTQKQTASPQSADKVAAKVAA